MNDKQIVIIKFPIEDFIIQDKNGKEIDISDLSNEKQAKLMKHIESLKDSYIKTSTLTL